MKHVKLTKEIVEIMESSLNRGYDLEVRTNKYGLTVAEVSKRVVYKDNPLTESEVNEKAR